MATIEQAYEQMKAIQKNMRAIGMNALKQTNEDYLDAQREQMLSGEDSTGGIIGHYASKIYGDYKLGKNPKAGGNVDLFDTGAFQEELTLRLLNGVSFTVYSQDIKSKLLEKKYGSTIFGLNQRHLEVYRKGSFVRPFKEGINKYWNGIR